MSNHSARSDATSGLLCSLEEAEGGGLTLSLDDVARDKNGAWVKQVHYTNKVVAREDILDTKMSEKELADFGLAVIARLAALHKHPYGSSSGNAT